MDVFLQSSLIIFEQSFDYTPYNFTTKKNNNYELKLYKIYLYVEDMNLSKYTLISCIKFIHPQITYYAFGKITNFIYHTRYTSNSTTNVGGSTLNSKQKDNIDNNIDDKNYYIKQILFGDRILYFRIPYTKCNLSTDDNTNGNKYIDPDTWMDIPPYN